MRTTKISIALAASVVLVTVLAGCSSTQAPAGGGSTSGSSSSTSGSSGTGAYGSDSGSTSTPAAPAASDGIGVAESSLGQVIVDGKGMTAYLFTSDTQNGTSSSCTGQCATAWPAIETTSDTPKVTGVTGTVGAITGVDGNKQVTVNGWPIYTFANDKAPGDVKGQNVGSSWFVLSPAGTPIK